MYPFLPSVSSFLSHKPAVSSEFIRSVRLHLHWLIARCFTYQLPSENRVDLFEFLWYVISEFRFDWLNESITSANSGIPDIESTLTNEKLVKVIARMSSVEVRVQLDYFYKDVVSIYEQKKDKKVATRDVSKRLLLVEISRDYDF